MFFSILEGYTLLFPLDLIESRIDIFRFCTTCKKKGIAVQIVKNLM